MPEMTYEELIGEIGYRIEELGGVGKHATAEGARLSYAMALDAVEKLEAAARELRRMIREVGYELYLAK